MYSLWKVFGAALVAVICISCIAQNSNSLDQTLRLMSFNIRTSYANDPGDRNWDIRKQAVIHVIDTRKPVIIGLQEASEVQREFLLSSLDDTWTYSEFESILYRKGVFSVLRSGRIELIEDKWEPRYAEWLLLDKNGASFLFINTHWGVDTKSQQGSAGILIEALPKLSDDWNTPVILLGDFNIQPSSDVYRIIQAQTPMQSQYSGLTFTAFEEDISQLDYVWSSGMKKLLCESSREKVNGIRPSDHHAIFCDVEL